MKDATCTWLLLMTISKIDTTIRLPTSLIAESENGCDSSMRYQDYVLVELPDSHIIESSITIKAANQDDNLVLCTKNNTFLMKRILSTNSTLLVENIVNEDFKKVAAILDDYIEIVPFKPRIDAQLLSILSQTLYDGHKDRTFDNTTKIYYTKHDLLCLLPCSEQELENTIKNHPIIEYQGCIRLVSQDYLYHFLRLLVSNYEHAGNSLLTLKDLIVDDSHPSDIVQQLFHIFATIDMNNIILNHLKIIKFFGEYLLASKISWILDEFIDSWRELVVMIDSEAASIEQLYKYLNGLYVIEHSSQDHIFYYPEHQLSSQSMERFKALFKLRKKWLFEDILPFIR